MKVIKKGRQQKGWSKEFTCTGKGNGDGGCGAVLLVSEGDLFRTSRCYFDGSSDHYTTFECSECGVLTDIECRGLPSVTRSYQVWKEENEK